MAVPPPQSMAGMMQASTHWAKLASSPFICSGGVLQAIEQSCHHISQVASKSIVGHSFDAVMMRKMCGNRNKIPLCIPVPRPIEESTPSPNHHVTYAAEKSINSTIFWLHSPQQIILNRSTSHFITRIGSPWDSLFAFKRLTSAGLPCRIEGLGKRGPMGARRSGCRRMSRAS